MLQGEDLHTRIHDIENIQKKDWYYSYAISANYTVTDIDKIKCLIVTTAAATITVTLPTAADNLFRTLLFIKEDDGAGKITVDGEGAEKINGELTQDVEDEYGYLRIRCDGVEWYIVSSTGGGAAGFESKVRVYRATSNQSIASGANVRVQLNGEDYDVLNEFDNAVNYRFVPAVNGYYAVAGLMNINSLDDGDYFNVKIRLNAADWFNDYKFNPGNALNIWTFFYTEIYVTTLDYVECWVRHNQGNNRDLPWSTNGSTNVVTIHRFY